MAGYKKIAKNPKANTNGFKQNPQNCHRDGRPRKLFSQVNAELKKLGLEEVTASQLNEYAMMLLNMTMEEVSMIASTKGIYTMQNINGQDTPVFLNKPEQYTLGQMIIAKNLLGKKGEEYLEKLRDRAHGKAQQSIDLEITQTPPLLPEL